MAAPRLRINIAKVEHNARTLVQRLAQHRISVTGVTKSALGSPEIARAMLVAGVSDLGDSRIENIEAMRHAQVRSRISLIRSPMLSQAKRVVASADVSFNSELTVIKRLSYEALQLGRTHAVVLMVELGDLREGIMPDDLLTAVHETLQLPNIVFQGIGANLACQSGVAPDAGNMGELSRLAALIGSELNTAVELVSGGNSANLDWAFNGNARGRVNNLRLGESILLGREALHRQPLEGLHTDAITLIAEVIEAKRKPTKPWGRLGQSAFGQSAPTPDRGCVLRSILALGVQDVDPAGLVAPLGMEILGSSGDHLVTTSDVQRAPVGAEVTFQLDYGALLRAMTSPHVAKTFE